MKYKILTFVILLGSFLTSCTTDNVDAAQGENNVNQVLGTWNLVQSRSSDGVDYDYDEIVVTYTFEEDNILTVVNNAIETTDLSPKPSGKLMTRTYSYVLIENNGNAYIRVMNEDGVETELGRIALGLNESLIIDQTSLSAGADFYDYILNFER